MHSIYCVGLMTPARCCARLVAPPVWRGLLQYAVPVRSTLLAQLFALFLKGRHDSFVVANYSDIGTLVNRCIGVAVHRYNGLRVAAPRHMLRGAGNRTGDVQFWTDNFACQTHLHLARHPAFIYRRARSP